MSDATIRIRCGQCEKRLRVPASEAGNTVRCPNCKAAIRVDAAEGEDGPIGLAGEEERPRDVLRDLLPPDTPRRGNTGGSPRAARTRHRRRGAGLGASARFLLSLPVFALAVVGAMFTAWNGACFILFRVIQVGHDSGEAQASSGSYFFLGLLVTMGLFWVAECVKHGRFVWPDEVFHTKKGP
jgi:hypothetical protein